jgi:hypothetical protein
MDFPGLKTTDGGTRVDSRDDQGVAFSLRRGHYSEALRVAAEMMTLATAAKDDEAFATAQRMAGVSRRHIEFATLTH